jgi:hypothetical protein
MQMPVEKNTKLLSIEFIGTSHNSAGKKVNKNIAIGF